MIDMLSKSQLEDDLKQAMRAGDDLRKRTLRMALSAIKLAEVDKRRELEERELLAILRKEVKSRQETLVEARELGREDLAEAAQAEIEILRAYLPQPLKPEEIERIARDTIAEVGATAPQDMGKVMKDLMPCMQGRADGKLVSDIVRRLLSDS